MDQELRDTLGLIVEKLDSLDRDMRFVKKVVVNVENDHGKKLDALFDGYKANYEMVGQFDPRVTRLEREVERLSVELQFLRQAK